MNAQVISVFPDKIRIVVDDLEDFQVADESLKVGSYLKIEDNENVTLIAVIENFQISLKDSINSEGQPITVRDHVIEALPLGILRDGTFERGSDSIAIPPKEVKPASLADVKSIYEQSILEEDKFCFASFLQMKVFKFL